MKTMVETTCFECGKIFKKLQSEVNRSKKLNRNIFCSNTCSCTLYHKEAKKDYKICEKCTAHYKPSSRHKICPSCRYDLEKKICPICNNVEIRKQSKSCHSCSFLRPDRKVVKRERNNEFYMNEIMRRIKARCIDNQRLTYDIDTAYLVNLWEEQKGKCSYTGIDLILPSEKGINDKIFTSSLDRKDSNIGYIKGNVHFVSMGINYMKNNMSHEDTIKFIDIIRRN
jgi:hypothetical protein